ncbi:MAG: phosphatidylglycerophosphatase A [Zoogloeaceae bacterium]|nr:phosphatidylglycerophosphatase A [Zoogloeaceae bacterium]
MRPDLRFLLAHPSHFIALGFGSGLAPKAPGTFGTLLGWLLFPALSWSLSDGMLLGLLVIFFIGGVLAADRAGRTLGVPDHGAIVWDEMVAIWLVLVFAPPTLLWQAVAVALFRFFDIVKPPPVRNVEAALKGGFGVMADDIVAAAYALLVLAILVRLSG